MSDKGMKLKRADIEWLLANHENGRGPVDYHDLNQRDRVGLDLRGADLSYAHLQNLPLARTIGDVTWRTWTTLTEKQHRTAAIQLQHADLKDARLEGSSLEYAILSITAFHGRVFSSPFLPDTPQSIVTAAEAVVGFTFEGIFIAMLTQRFFGR
jgi:uncharacterized protein YjbI with pentapeptide repeats